CASAEEYRAATWRHLHSFSRWSGRWPQARRSQTTDDSQGVECIVGRPCRSRQECRLGSCLSWPLNSSVQEDKLLEDREDAQIAPESAEIRRKQGRRQLNSE